VKPQRPFQVCQVVTLLGGQSDPTCDEQDAKKQQPEPSGSHSDFRLNCPKNASRPI
jgi:hypothetical protein